MRVAAALGDIPLQEDAQLAEDGEGVRRLVLPLEVGEATISVVVSELEEAQRLLADAEREQHRQGGLVAERRASADDLALLGVGEEALGHVRAAVLSAQRSPAM